MRNKAAVLVLIAVILSGCRIDHGLGPRYSSWSGIEGTVTFLGEWLEETEEVRVAVYRAYPPTDSSDFFAIAGFSDALPLGAPNSSYRVSLAKGRYEWVVVAGRREGLDWVEGYVFLGQFVASPDDTTPSPVTVYKDRSTPGVDVTVDFSNLPDLPPIGKPGLEFRGWR